MKLRINYSYIAALSVSIIAALLIGTVVLLISGYDPLAAYSAMLSGAFSNARRKASCSGCGSARSPASGPEERAAACRCRSRSSSARCRARCKNRR